MKRAMIPLAALLMTVPAFATAKIDAADKGHWIPKPTLASACPPGLAKKSPACVPPGLAKHANPDRLNVGDRLAGDNYIIVRDPARYGLDPYATYYQYGGRVYQVDRETREVLALIGAVSAILN